MKKQKNSGITLIALVITIVVLVILVGVSVSVVINTGLIENTKTAVNDYNKKQKQEQLDMEKIAGKLNIYSMEEVKAGGYTGTSNKKYVDGDKIAYIPAGFTVSNVEGETSIDGGLVIYSNVSNTTTEKAVDYMAKIKSGTSGYTVATLQSTYNQYVWIPVENPSDIYGTDKDGNKLGKLYNFGTYRSDYVTTPSAATKLNWDEDENGVMSWIKTSNGGLTPYYEPAYLNSATNADGSIYNVDANGNKIITKEGIQDEFNKMINSVETYNGFYIGRYELTGSALRPTVVKGKDPLKASRSYSVNTYLRWYGLYSMCQKLEDANNDAKGKVTTTMIWGCQWDQAIKKSLIATTDSSTGVSDFLTDGKKYGVCDVDASTYTGTKASAYNIFDMGGNVVDWTQETYNSMFRCCRGRLF